MKRKRESSFLVYSERQLRTPRLRSLFKEILREMLAFVDAKSGETYYVANRTSPPISFRLSADELDVLGIALGRYERASSSSARTVKNSLASVTFEHPKELDKFFGAGWNMTYDGRTCIALFGPLTFRVHEIVTVISKVDDGAAYGESFVEEIDRFSRVRMEICFNYSKWYLADTSIDSIQEHIDRMSRPARSE